MDHRRSGDLSGKTQAQTPGLPAGLLITFPAFPSGEGVNARSHVDGLTTLDYTMSTGAFLCGVKTVLTELAHNVLQKAPQVGWLRYSRTMAALPQAKQERS